MQRRAKVFMNNRSQAVRLPKEFQFSMPSMLDTVQWPGLDRDCGVLRELLMRSARPTARMARFGARHASQAGIRNSAI